MTSDGRLYGNYKNIAIKPDPGDFEPLITITEMPPKKSKRSTTTPRKLENVIQKLINHSDSDDDDLDFVKQRLASDKTPKRSYSKSGRKKTTPKKIGKRKKSFKKANEEEDDDDEEEDQDDDDNDEDYKPEKKKKSKRSKDEDKEEKTKVKIEPIDYDSDEYVNPFNYGFDTPQAPARKRKAFAKQQTVPTKAVPTKSKWACLICLADLPSKEALITHYADHKDDPIKQETADIPPEHLQNIVPPDVSNSPAFCHICGKVCDSERKLKKHSETHVEEQFYCGYCSTTFETAYDFSVHSRSHTIESKFRCDMCDFETLFPKALKAHVQRHETDFRYRCEVCNKGFYSHNWYEEHKNFHTGAKPFICDICDKPFAYTRYLTAHKRSMHPESYKDEPIINECIICQKRFAHKKSLMLHMRGHTGENSVLCDICGKRLSSNEHLKFHRRIHTGYKPYTCDVCSKGFAKKCNLTLHLRVHSGEKPYICDVCGKCFSQRSTLVIHERYHTGARPYTCHLCHKGFVAKGVLSIHLKSCNRNTIMGNLLE